MTERPTPRTGTDVVASRLGRRWIRACTIAETIGMTAAAAASVAARHLDSGLAALSLVVVGGLVEGTALGSLQGQVLAARWGRPVWRGWPALAVLAMGPPTGLIAGAALGVVTRRVVDETRH